MILSASGSIFDSPARALVNPVNCVGVMGKGLALEFKRRFPANFRAYADACDAGQVRPGMPLFFETEGGRIIVNFPTKRHWRDKSRLEDIVFGLVWLRGYIADKQIDSIAIPALGCGLGGLDWKDVRAAIVEVFAELRECRVELYPPK